MISTEEMVKEFLRLISALRIEQGLTHEQLSEMAGVHRTTIGLLDRQERIPTLLVAADIARSLGYPLSELILRAEDNCVQNMVQEPSAQYGTPRRRKVERSLLRREDDFYYFTGMDPKCLTEAIESCYHTLDIIDEQLIARKSPKG